MCSICVWNIVEMSCVSKGSDGGGCCVQCVPGEDALEVCASTVERGMCSKK